MYILPSLLAEAIDYLNVDDVIQFAVGQDEVFLTITILDDRNDPVKEGQESFNLKFDGPENAQIAMPEETKVVINDEKNDGNFSLSSRLFSYIFYF